VRAVAVAAIAVALVGCSDSSSRSPAAERGRQVYLAQCTACHNTDPSQPGPVGPAVKDASRELLEAKVVRGAYPPGYTPKRPTTLMPLQPQLATEIPALAEFLK
jgi:mono/diheme cytochrome c family protein